MNENLQDSISDELTNNNVSDKYPKRVRKEMKGTDLNTSPLNTTTEEEDSSESEEEGDIPELSRNKDDMNTGCTTQLDKKILQE